ncbi:MAG: O-antigen ligase family protein [Desulfobacterales bacterium]
MFNYVRVLTYILIFLLPAMANLVRHGGSVTFTLLAAFGLGAWFKRKTQPVFERNEKILMLTFAVYFAVCLIHFLGGALLSPDIPLDWDLDHEIRFLGFIPIYYLLIHWTGMKDWVFWYGLAAGAVCSLGYAIWQAYIIQIGGRVVGPYYAIGFGDLAIVFGFMAFAGMRYFFRQSPLLISIPAIALCGGMLAAFWSGTLGAMLAVPVLTLLFLIQLGDFSRPWLYRFIALMVIGLISVGYYQMAGMPIPERVHSEMAEARTFFDGRENELEGEQAYRLRVWSRALSIYKENPILGVGKEQYRERIHAATGINCSHLHNMFLENLVTYGIFGLLLLGVYLFPVYMLISAILKTNSTVIKDFAYAGLNLTCGFIVFSMTECIFYRNLFISTYIVLVAVIFALIKQYQPET